MFSYLALNHGDLSVLMHSPMKENREDHDGRKGVDRGAVAVGAGQFAG